MDTSTISDGGGWEPGRYVQIMGIPFAAITEQEAADAIVDAAVRRSGYWIITANLDHVRRYRRDEVAKHLLDAADVIVADGMPLIWASRLAGEPLPERIAGSNLIWSISRLAGIKHASVFLLGGNPGVAELAAATLQRSESGLTVAGTCCPRIGFEADTEELERIEVAVTEADPRIVFVGLPFPKQELLIIRLRRILPDTAFIGVGISFSFVGGELSRAPEWTHGLGLEWLFRLRQEPKRLARRYLVHGVPFALQLLLVAARRRVLRLCTGRARRWHADA